MELSKCLSTLVSTLASQPEGYGFKPWGLFLFHLFVLFGSASSLGPLSSSHSQKRCMWATWELVEVIVSGCLSLCGPNKLATVQDVAPPSLVREFKGTPDPQSPAYQLNLWPVISPSQEKRAEGKSAFKGCINHQKWDQQWAINNPQTITHWCDHIWCWQQQKYLLCVSTNELIMIVTIITQKICIEIWKFALPFWFELFILTILIVVRKKLMGTKKKKTFWKKQGSSTSAESNNTTSFCRWAWV